jgi:carboxyl-terminal processing protease
VFVVIAMLVLSLVAHHQAEHSRYAGVFGQALRQIRGRYIEDLDDRVLFEAAMNGMVKKLDENSAFLGQQELKQFLQQSIDKEIAGIGVQLDLEQDKLMVWDVVPGTPADRASIRAGDEIISIDGTMTAGLTDDEARDRIQGEVGTPVVLGIKPSGQSTADKRTLVRELFTVASVVGYRRRSNGTWDYSLPGQPRLRLVRLTNFAKNTAEELRSVLDDLVAEGMAALVLDLRGNTGGLLDKAVEIADMFLEEGTIVTVRDKYRRVREEHSASAPGTYGDFPMAVLINGGSASASEIVAAALQDHGRAIVVGSQSYGKGTVQNLINLVPNRAMLKLTTATYWRPSGRNIHRTAQNESSVKDWGVQPDVGCEVVLDEDSLKRWSRARRERERYTHPRPSPHPPEPQNTSGADAAFDPQLDRAIERLQRKTAAKPVVTAG